MSLTQEENDEIAVQEDEDKVVQAEDLESEDEQQKKNEENQAISVSVSAEPSPLSTPAANIFSQQNHASFASHLSPNESIYESAAKLLFMSIKWARSVPSFLQLQDGDQTLLLEDSWAQLFIIGLAQWSIQLDDANLIRESLTSREEYGKLSSDARILKDVTTKLMHLRLDHTEFTCLKALSLFKPGTEFFIAFSKPFSNTCCFFKMSLG